MRFKRDCKGCLKKQLSGLNRRYRIRDATTSYAVGGEILNLHMLIIRWLFINSNDFASKYYKGSTNSFANWRISALYMLKKLFIFVSRINSFLKMQFDLGVL